MVLTMRFLTAIICWGFVVLGVASAADKSLEGKACRSVHLAYEAGEGTAFYNEVTVDESAPGTYFCVCGWNKGYYGIQELGNGKKLAIFSVWDSNADDPKALAREKRVQLLHRDPRVRVGRFGGEGSGGQSFFDFDWKKGATYRFLVTAKTRGERTEFAGYFRAPGDPAWTHLVTFSTITGGAKLSGYYAFVEDFKRDVASARIVRRAHYSNAWVKTVKDGWKPVTQARFTADSNPVLNIDAGVDQGSFFLATGGDTKNQTTRLRERMTLPQDARHALPDTLPATP